jgi:hypothetical protein
MLIHNTYRNDCYVMLDGTKISPKDLDPEDLRMAAVELRSV